MSIYARRGLIVRIILLAAAVLWWALTGFGRLRRHRVVTLCYHGVKADQRSLFRRQMSLIASRAIDLPGMRRSRGAASPPPRVRVTFDDAFANLLDNAIPIVRELRIPITIFVPADCLGMKPPWRIAADHPDACEPIMTAGQVAEAAGSALCRIGSHGATHRPLTELSAEDIREELVRSKRVLERLTGRPVDDFAFPHGACNAELIQAARAAGYTSLHTLAASPVPPINGVDVIPRLSMSPDAWLIEFRLTIDGAYDWLPAVQRFAHALTRRTRRITPRPTGAAHPGITAIPLMDVDRS